MATKMEPSSINSCWINKGSQIWMSSWNSQFSPGWYFVQKPAMLIPALCSSPFKKSRNLCHLNMVSLKIKWPSGSMPSAFSSQLVRNLGLLPPSTFPWNHKTKKPFMLLDKQENKITEAIKKRTMNQQVKTETSRIMRRVKLGLTHRPVTFLDCKRPEEEQILLLNCWKVRLERSRRSTSLILRRCTKPCWKVSLIHAACTDRWKQCSFCFPGQSASCFPIIQRSCFLSQKRLSPEEGALQQLLGMLKGPQHQPRGRKQHIQWKPWSPPGNGLIIPQHGDILKSIFPLLIKT